MYPDKISYGPEGFGGYCDTSATNGHLLPENVTPLYLRWGILVTGFDFIFVLRLSLLIHIVMTKGVTRIPHQKYY